MIENDGPRVIGQEAARLFCDAEPDLAVRQMLEMLFTRVLLEQPKPESDVDVMFVLRAARRMFARKEQLARILDGEDLHWFPDE